MSKTVKVTTTTTTRSSVSSSSNVGKQQQDLIWLAIAGYVFYLIAMAAYRIRLHAIEEFGPVIHEFDPYFNYRATEYLYWNGAERFFSWFDHMSWYPLGRPVGTTIYPGMQFIAVWLKQALDQWLGEKEKDSISEGEPLEYMSLNDVCCYIPAWFGVIASTVTGLIAYECSLSINTSASIFTFVMDLIRGRKSLPPPSPPSAAETTSACGCWFESPALEIALLSMGMMAIVPAHLMRSVGGGYDNESVAITAMVLTFYFWVRSLRQPAPAATNNNNKKLVVAVPGTTTYAQYWSALLCGLSYFYMVAAWGGYVFVLNLIGVHAAVLVLLGRFDTKVYTAYTIFYVVGTTLAIQVPVVGWTPLKSLEQLGPTMVFVGFQLLQATEVYKRQQGLDRKAAWMLRLQVAGVAAAVLMVLALMLAPTGYFGPISARVRGLFVKHTKTGNPLVDSVAEHQPASSRAYFQYLHHVCTLAPIGYFIVMLGKCSDASSFLVVWGTAAYFFSHKMVRLILLTAPIGSILGGIAAGRIFCWCLAQWWHTTTTTSGDSSTTTTTTMTTVSNGEKKNGDEAGGKGSGKKGNAASAAKASKKRAKNKQAAAAAAASGSSSFEELEALQKTLSTALATKEGVVLKRSLALLILIMGYLVGNMFVKYCFRLSVDLSNPSIILKARDKDNQIVKVDDYREAYWWLRDNTPEDSRVMAWWDYGYQIAGIANRTTLADGNTWNHEHIALLGKTLTTDLESGYEIARHLADYVLVWAGGRGDDMAKSPHLARIANSVYRDHCGDEDPTCRAFGFIDQQGTPSPMMARSMLFRLHSHKLRPGVEVPADKFQEVLRTKYGFVRIYKILGVSEESRAWCADPANRICDAEGSWFCPGQYPPALQSILARGRDFAQLEDFNRGGGETDAEYQKRYFEDLQNPGAAKRKAMQEGGAGAAAAAAAGPDQPSQPEEEEVADEPKSVDELYNTWEDTEDTTLMWKLISSNAVDELTKWLEEQPHKAFVRSRDGRGPMWWAFEQRNEAITNLLMKKGVPHTDKDAKGMTPVDLLESATGSN